MAPRTRFVFSTILGIIVIQAVSWIPGVNDYFLHVSKVLVVATVPTSKVPTRIRTAADQAEMSGLLPPGARLPVKEYLVVRTMDGKRVYSTQTEALALPGGAVGLIDVPLLLGLLAFVLVILSKRSIDVSLAGGSALAMLVSWGIWLSVAGLPSSNVLSHNSLSWPIFIKSSGGIVQSDLLILLVGTLFLSSMVAGLGVLAGNAVTRRITGTTRCSACGALFRWDGPGPIYCPACGAGLSTGKVRWNLAGLALSATLLVFYLFVLLAGPKLGFYSQCRGTGRNEACKTTTSMVHRAQKEHDTWVSAWWQRDADHLNQSRLMAIHSAKYVLWTAIIFVFGPLFVAWKGGLRGMATAGATILLSWLGATLVALFFLGFGMFEGSVILALKIHVAAGLVWSIMGLVGALIGHRMNASAFEEIMEQTM